MTRGEMVAELTALGWTLDGPHPTSSGYKASISRGERGVDEQTVFIAATTEEECIEALLVEAEKRRAP